MRLYKRDACTPGDRLWIVHHVCPDFMRSKKHGLFSKNSCTFATVVMGYFCYNLMTVAPFEVPFGGGVSNCISIYYIELSKLLCRCFGSFFCFLCCQNNPVMSVNHQIH